jgi:hypothetical protein
MEKRIARVVRWLERCVSASKSKAWHNALTEMECARAELEEARRELWELAAENEQPKRNMFVVDLSRVAALAIFFLCVLSVPLSAPIGNSQRNIVMNNDDLILEWVTSDEKAVLAGLRKSLSESNLEALKREQKNELEKIPLPSATTVSSFKPVPVQPKKQISFEPEQHVFQDQKKSDEKPVALERILTLMQIGQNALREEGPAIIINRQ